MDKYHTSSLTQPYSVLVWASVQDRDRCSRLYALAQGLLVCGHHYLLLRNGRLAGGQESSGA